MSLTNGQLCELLELARDAGVRISIGTDAHHLRELASMEFGLAAAIRAGIPRDRILNFLGALTNFWLGRVHDALSSGMAEIGLVGY